MLLGLLEGKTPDKAEGKVGGGRKTKREGNRKPGAQKARKPNIQKKEERDRMWRGRATAAENSAGKSHTRGGPHEAKDMEGPHMETHFQKKVEKKQIAGERLPKRKGRGKSWVTLYNRYREKESIHKGTCPGNFEKDLKAALARVSSGGSKKKRDRCKQVNNQTLFPKTGIKGKGAGSALSRHRKGACDREQRKVHLQNIKGRGVFLE